MLLSKMSVSAFKNKIYFPDAAFNPMLFAIEKPELYPASIQRVSGNSVRICSFAFGIK